MKSESFKNKTREELIKSLEEKRTALRGFKFGSSGSRIKNVKEGSVLRKDIARILTLLNTK